MAICECGCSEEIPPKPHHRYTNPRFKHGHHGRAGLARKPDQPPSNWVPPSGICECGCGTPTLIARSSNRNQGVYKGFPRRFISGHNRRVGGGPIRYQLMHGKRVAINAASHPDEVRESGRWVIAGKATASSGRGYAMVYAPNHPSARTDGTIAEHRLVMERALGRFLEKHERVHHRNGDRADNRPENLELWKVRKKDPQGVRASDYHCAGCRCFDHAVSP